MKKKFKFKKRINKKVILLFVIFIFFLIFIFNYKIDILRISKSEIIHNIFKTNNNYCYEDLENEHISKKIYNYIEKNIFNSPVNLLKAELNYNNELSSTTSFVYSENSNNLIYLYSSHQGETYSREYLEEHNLIPDVMMASNMLKDKLEDIGVNSIVETSDILEYMRENNLKHADSYIASRYFLDSAIKKYPQAKLYIDIHRDAVSHDASTTIINNKPCAKVLFVIGLENQNYENNLSVVTKINNIILSKYPTLTRGILKKKGYGVNGIYNQDAAFNVILMEIGGNENNIEEINNTTDLIAEVIGEYLNEKG